MSQYNPIIRPTGNKEVDNVLKEMDRHIKMELMAIGKRGIEGSQVIVHTSSGVSSPAPSTIIDYRAGFKTVVDGTNTVPFSSSLSSSDYVIDFFMVDSDGVISSCTPIMSSRTPSSFQITCLGAGTLYYKCMLTK
jgi:hypothetical protein